MSIEERLNRIFPSIPREWPVNESERSKFKGEGAASMRHPETERVESMRLTPYSCWILYTSGREWMGDLSKENNRLYIRPAQTQLAHNFYKTEEV